MEAFQILEDALEDLSVRLIGDGGSGRELSSSKMEDGEEESKDGSGGCDGHENEGGARQSSVASSSLSQMGGETPAAKKTPVCTVL